MTDANNWQRQEPETAPKSIPGIIPPIVYTRCKCPQCGALNSIVFKYPDIPPIHKCRGCQQLVPGAAFLVVTYTNLPLAPLNQELDISSRKEVNP